MKPTIPSLEIICAALRDDRDDFCGDGGLKGKIVLHKDHGGRKGLNQALNLQAGIDVDIV